MLTDNTLPIVTLLIGLIVGVLVALWVMKNKNNTVDIQPLQATLKAEQQLMLRELEQVHKATTLLDRVLRQPVSRGQWGELTLKRVVELTGMTNKCDFVEQVSLPNSEQRPDLIVYLPGNRLVAVDAKAPLDAYMQAIEIEDDGDRKKKLIKYAQQVRERFSDLASKKYNRELSSPEFVVMFLPTEAIFRAALEHDFTLIEFGAKRGVLLASPVSLIAILRSIAYSWSQEERSEHVFQIAEMGRELSDLLSKFSTCLTELTKNQQSAMNSFKLFLEVYHEVDEYAARFRTLDSTSQPVKMEIRKLRGTIPEYVPTSEQHSHEAQEVESIEMAIIPSNDIKAG